MNMSDQTMLPFNQPYLSGMEITYISEALSNGHLSGDGYFTAKCNTWLEQNIGCRKALITHSCTAALEMAAILADLSAGDEVIMPSYTFVSTANAFVLRGAKPVFVDIRCDTQNINELLIEKAITKMTKAIVAVHYAGVSCEMNSIMKIAKKHNLLIIEDAAQGILSTYDGRALGSIGDIGCLSFHETKNIISGEGGAILINNPKLVSRAEIIREKGTNRSQFFRGQVDKYTWKDIGSSYLPSEVMAAFLWAQLQDAQIITNKRLSIWDRYFASLSPLEKKGVMQLPKIPENSKHNAHMFYMILKDIDTRSKFISIMKSKNIQCSFHYVPLHNSPEGMKVGRFNQSLENTVNASECLVRLPLWPALSEAQQEHVIKSTIEALREIPGYLYV